MLTPTAADIREQSRVDFEDPDVGYPAPAGADPDPLQGRVDEAAAYIVFVTARDFAAVPAALEPIMRQATRMRVEQVVMASRAEAAETAGDFDMIASFGAGAYSESRRGLADANEAKAGMLNPWPELNRLLWLLLGLTPAEVAAGGNAAVDDRRDYWRFMLGMAPNAPAWQVVEVDWQRNGSAYGQLPFGESMSLGYYGEGYHNPW